MDKELLEYNQYGIFPLPNETEEEFRDRAKKMPHFANPSSPMIEKLYDIKPSWVPVRYTNARLHLWEAAATFDEEGEISIELRREFETATHYLRFWKREEILAHEYVHAVRFPLGAEKYEEFFAYFLSFYHHVPVRAFLGPIFSADYEVKIFLLTLALPLMVLLLAPSQFMISLLAFCFVFLFATCRLFIRWKRWCETLKKIGPALMIRLLDDEIDQFSKMDAKEIEREIEEKGKNNFRWQLLAAAYCKK
jgi:hypothetical protein